MVDCGVEPGADFARCSVLCHVIVIYIKVYLSPHFPPPNLGV